MQELTSFLRLASVLAASEKYLEYVQPPSETTTCRFGYFFSSSWSWWKLPFSGWLNVSLEPSTLIVESNDFW